MLLVFRINDILHLLVSYKFKIEVVSLLDFDQHSCEHLNNADSDYNTSPDAGSTLFVQMIVFITIILSVSLVTAI